MTKESHPPIANVITYLGGGAKVAKLLGVSEPTVSRIRKTGITPFHHVERLVQISDERGLGLVPDDFFYSDRLDQLLHEGLRSPGAYSNG